MGATKYYNYIQITYIKSENISISTIYHPVNLYSTVNKKIEKNAAREEK